MELQQTKSLSELHACEELSCHAQKIASYLVKRFDFGPSFYFVYDYTQSRYIFAESRIEQITQYTTDELTRDSDNFFLTRMHPEDVPQHQIAMKRWQEYFSQLPIEEHNYYSTSFDYRLQKKNGRYVRLLHQNVYIEYDTMGNPIFGLEKCTNISHWHKKTEMVLTIIGPEAGKNLIYCPAQNLIATQKPLFTETEIKILKLLEQGMSSRKIADKLDIAFYTVTTHRRNMRNKAAVKNTASLIKIAREQGILTNIRV